MTEQRKHKHYQGEDIDVIYEPGRCTHAAECVMGLPAVFNTRKRPWVAPDKAEADRVAEIVLRCPTGALHFTRVDDGDAETPDDRNIVMLKTRGPIYLRGDIRVESADGSLVLEDTRIALCRCGNSRNKPFCDNSHIRIGFNAGGRLSDDTESEESFTPGGKLLVTISKKGPYLLEGNFEIQSLAGKVLYQGTEAALCRCGSSENKPFCDGSHRRTGFEG